MNTNIFDFQNSESSMQFNPLFLPVNTFADNTGSIKSFKISDSSYLFSDIIKVFTGANLLKNLDLNLPSEISSEQVPTEDIFSFNLSDNNDLSGIPKALNNGNVSSSNLKTIIALISKLLQAGQNNSLQSEISLVSNKTANDNTLTSEGLKTFLNELNTLIQNADENVNPSKEKNKTDKNTKEIISKILNSLNKSGIAIINIIGQNETLKIELNKTGIETLENNPGTANHESNFINGLPNENENYIKSDLLTNSDEIQDNKLTFLAEQTAQNSNENSLEKPIQNSNSNSVEKIKQNSNILSITQTEYNSKTKVKAADSVNIEKLLAELGEEETKVLKDNEKLPAGINNKTEITDTKSISRRTTNSLKSFNVDINSKGNDVYKLKFEIVDNEKNSQNIKNHPDLNNAENLVKDSSASIKSKYDSLTIENLVASKNSLKNISKLTNQANNSSVKTDVRNISNVKIEINNNAGETKNTTENLKSVSLNQENDIKTVKENNKNPEFQVKTKLNEKTPEQGTAKFKSVKNDIQKSIKVEHSITNKDNSENPGITKEIAKDANINTDVSKEIKVAGSDTQSTNHKETISNSHLSDNIKVNNSAKINPNNSSENNFSDNLSDTKQDLLNNSKGQDQISNDKGDNAFSSYLNKIDVNNIQNIKRPVYLNNIADQMKTIDSAEIVKEISNLASDKDQKNIVLKLVPETLGKVKILLDITNNIIHAHAEVENEAAKSLMQNNLESLKQALSQQGMQLNSLNISLSNHQEQKSNRSYLLKKKFIYAESQIGEIDEKENTNVSKHYGYNTYEFLA